MTRARLVALSLVVALSGAACKSAPSGEELSATDCPVLLAPGKLPATLEEVAAAKAKGASWSNREIRARYVCFAANIGAENAKWKAEGLSAEARAKRAYQVRHDARVTARAMMANAADVATLEERDRAKYGSPDGPTFEWLVQRAEAKGLHGDAVFEEIVASSQRTDQSTNTSLGL
ncbi:MAG: hypothetical protein U0441_17220 [Polyangiaceae bacterium]